MEIEKIKKLLQDVENNNKNGINKQLLIDTISRINILINDLETILYHNNKGNKLMWK